MPERNVFHVQETVLTNINIAPFISSMKAGWIFSSVGFEAEPSHFHQVQTHIG